MSKVFLRVDVTNSKPPTNFLPVGLVVLIILSLPESHYQRHSCNYNLTSWLYENDFVNPQSLYREHDTASTFTRFSDLSKVDFKKFLKHFF